MHAEPMNRFSWRWQWFLILLVLPFSLFAQIQNGRIKLTPDTLQPGQMISLSGDWLYKPGYAVNTNESPQSSTATTGYKLVPVPQLLNRVYWWLDDSEDFKRHENERLAKLGFDTDKAEDGWYRLTLDSPALAKDQKMFIEFDGVAMKCKLFCNGKAVGEHTGMFSRFGFDLSPYLRPGENSLAVYVSMEKIPASSLQMGEAVTVNLTASKVRSLSKGMYGPLSPGFENHSYDLHGIWQPVRLAIRGPARIEDVWFSPSLDGAEIRVQASSATPRSEALLSAKWTELGTSNTFAELEPEKVLLGNSSVQSLWLRNAHPRLWTPADPNLYRLEVRLTSNGGELLDSWSKNVGFRTFEIRSNQFFLNGHRYWLRGADHLPYGKNPWDPELPRRLIKMLHDANVRITRTHATPWNESWLDAADELGLAVSVEGIRPWALAGKIGPTPPDLFQHWLMENEDVVRRCRNHPSVVIYTIGNEMMLRDTKNLEKWKQLSAVVKQTRRVDPTLPVIASSEYQRDPEFYSSLLQPNNIDDGDIDDIHRYNNWYGPSSFVADSSFGAEMKKNQRRRPFIGQEMSSGYPDLDTGLPVLRYTRDLLTPQAWVGTEAYPGSAPGTFLEHHRAITKRWAEQLRYQRADNTAGFMLFAAECWSSHTYDAATVRPYPVYEGIREAWAPVGLALETGRRRFYAGEEVNTAVFITNDDDRFQDHTNLDVELEVATPDGTRWTNRVGTVPVLAYYQSVPSPIVLKVPSLQDSPFATSNRVPARMVCRVLENGHELSRSSEPVEIFPRHRPQLAASAAATAVGLGPGMGKLAQEIFGPLLSPESTNEPDILLLAQAQSIESLKPGAKILARIENGATAIIFSPAPELSKLFSEDLIDVKAAEAEFADLAPVWGTPLATNLARMDIKWWAREKDPRLFVASQSHRLRLGGHGRELLRFIPPHSYISVDKVPEQYRTVLFELLLGKGRLWVCDLDLEQCMAVDPAAKCFAGNLLRAAADPGSTRNLPRVPSP